MLNKQTKRIIWFYLFCTGSVIFLSEFVPQRFYQIEHLQKKISKKHPHSYSEFEIFQDLCEIYPDSLPLQFRYIDLHREKASGFCTHFQYKTYSHTYSTQLFSEAYAAIQCQNPDIAGKRIREVEKGYSNFPYANYLLGLHERNQGNYAASKQYLNRETKINPEFEPTYLALYSLYLHYLPDELDNFMVQKEARRHLPLSIREYYYYTNTHPFLYIETIIEGRILNISLSAFFCALLISIFWIYYLRKLDFFNPEKYRDLALVFVLGTISTFLCLPLYDFAFYVMNWGINGNAMNDFAYSVLVIGFSEEIVKFLPWIIFATCFKKLKEPYDYIIYASIAALGFAFAENWMYLEDSENIVRRFLIAVVGHMTDACIIAYGFILARYKFKQKFWKKWTPWIAFGIACVFHGFYDFWLISPSVNDYFFVTYIFFAICLHLWFIMKNNAINNSSFFKNNLDFGSMRFDSILLLGIIAAIILEYYVLTFTYGALVTNSIISSGLNFVLIFSLYIATLAVKMQFLQGQWRSFVPKYRLRKSLGGYIPFSFTQNFGSENEFAEEDYYDLQLRLFTSKTNRYVGAQFPLSGKCRTRATIDGQDGFFFFKLNQELKFRNCIPDQVLIRPINPGDSLIEDKIEILFFMIPERTMLSRNSFSSKELIYIGKVFSRPL